MSCKDKSNTRQAGKESQYDSYHQYALAYSVQYAGIEPKRTEHNIVKFGAAIVRN